MNVKEKVGVLGFRPSSARAEFHGAAPGSLEAAAASGTRSERQAAAMQLWNKWAAEALGPLSADPNPEDLARKSRRVQRLEQECASLAARAQRRLEMSSALRSQAFVMGAGGGAAGPGGRFLTTGGGADAGTAVLLRTGTFNRDTQYAVRERRKAAAYAAVKAEGAAEAEAAAAAAAGTSGSGGGAGAGAPLAGGTGALSYKSRAMLDALIASRAAAGAAGGDLLLRASTGTGTGAVITPRSGSPKASGGRLRPHSALPGGSAAASGGRARPRSAAPLAASRQASFSASVAGAPGSPGGRSAAALRASGGSQLGGAFGYGAGSPSLPGGSGVAPSLPPGILPVPEGEYLALRQEVTSVSERLAAAQAALEVQADTEGQLRSALDLLRARLHSAGLREVEAQRRLAQHGRLEPLFDRLAEAFTFSSPEEVVARLEFLEDDKLGTFDQLLRTQEEVTRLQQKLAEAHKAGDTVATRLTTEHLQGSARMQQQNEELRQELEAMENLVQRLTARQAQLVALQTAVLQLWGKLTEDPQFAAAFGGGSPSPTGRAGSPGRAPTSPERERGSSPSAKSASGGSRRQSGAAGALLKEEEGAGGGGGGKGGGGGGGSGIELSDPLSMLHMIEEFVISKSNKLAIRHFTDIQRVANHVWQQHFKSRADIRGKVVPTFESLSDMADRMAGRVRAVAEEAGRSREAERALLAQVRRLQQQKRVLQDELAKKDETFRTIMGVPRRQRPVSAAAELERVLRRDAAVAAADASARDAELRDLAAEALGGGGGGGGLGLTRAISAASTYAHVTSDLPPGPHWQQHTGSIRESMAVAALSARRTAPLRLPAGSLFYLTPEQEAEATAAAEAAAAAGTGAGGDGDGDSAGGGGSGAGTPAAAEPKSPAMVAAAGAEGAAGKAAERPPSARWAAPQRSAIEQAFLARLERRTRIS
ncbi:hypothetical protein GPECTOR_176g224 [Gonium pectorale]|uniref:Uncharacterized protein n=1 Tax=Gonium pectorale TaxID=33097 RepID=A0A150FXA5_GONPE|nr:hypothetical protein GPECTOR_176g224 [Gonium pectorale]|eukprot:KXZ42243.1 hypothetical protein GPECTOR_176g224 [Gonium pectorale]